MSSSPDWTLKGGRVISPAPFIVCGIVNVTPDSFYDGGTHDSGDSGVAHALKLADEGAHILDVGGESSRPFAEEISLEQEIGRVIPVIEGIMAARPESVVSIDTYKAETAVRAMEAGALVVNDISAFAFDPELFDVVTQYRPGYVLMHSLGRPGTMQVDPRYDDVVSDVSAFLEDRMNRLVRAGLPESRIVLDPGIGFGKTLEHNLAILKNIDRIAALGRPVYMGLSNKSMFGKLLGLETEDRRTATQVATALLARRGVPIHRVHEVADTLRTLKLVRTLESGESL